MRENEDSVLGRLSQRVSGVERFSQGDKALAFSLQAETGKLAVVPSGKGA